MFSLLLMILLFLVLTDGATEEAEGANLGGDSRGAIWTMWLVFLQPVAGVRVFHGILHGGSLGPAVGLGFMVHLLGDAISSL